MSKYSKEEMRWYSLFMTCVQLRIESRITTSTKSEDVYDIADRAYLEAGGDDCLDKDYHRRHTNLHEEVVNNAEIYFTKLQARKKEGSARADEIEIIDAIIFD